MRVHAADRCLPAPCTIPLSLQASHHTLLALHSCRKNIEAGYLPLPTDLKFEGLAKDYYFDTYG